MKSEFWRRSLINPFQTNDPFLYPLKTLENLWLSDVSGGIEREHWLETGQYHNATKKDEENKN